MNDGDGKRVRRIGVVLTGGTIACEVEASVTGELVRLRGGENAPELDLVREVADGAIELSLRRPLRLTSENMSPANWVTLAEAVASLLVEDRVDAVLVLHGTDTMAYSAAALSFMLTDAGVPIVLTGANSPVGEPGSNARRNVEDSLVALAALDRGVYVLFGEVDESSPVHLGTRVRKVAAPGGVFASVGSPPAGIVRDGRFEPMAGSTAAPPNRPAGPAGSASIRESSLCGSTRALILDGSTRRSPRAKFGALCSSSIPRSPGRPASRGCRPSASPRAAPPTVCRWWRRPPIRWPASSPATSRPRRWRPPAPRSCRCCRRWPP